MPYPIALALILVSAAVVLVRLVRAVKAARRAEFAAAQSLARLAGLLNEPR